MSKTMVNKTVKKCNSKTKVITSTDSVKNINDVLTRAERISHIVDILSKFTPMSYETAFDEKPLFAREFLLRNLLGLSDEEFNLNEEMILNEQTEMIKAMQLANQVLQMQEHNDQLTQKQTTKVKKEKVN